MIHPLVESLQELTIPELDIKINNLNTRYFQTSNSEVQRQILQILNMYQMEVTNRRDKELEIYFNKDKEKLRKLINIS